MTASWPCSPRPRRAPSPAWPADLEYVWPAKASDLLLATTPAALAAGLLLSLGLLGDVPFAGAYSRSAPTLGVVAAASVWMKRSLLLPPERVAAVVAFAAFLVVVLAPRVTLRLARLRGPQLPRNAQELQVDIDSDPEGQVRPRSDSLRTPISTCARSPRRCPCWWRLGCWPGFRAGPGRHWSPRSVPAWRCGPGNVGAWQRVPLAVAGGAAMAFVVVRLSSGDPALRLGACSPPCWSLSPFWCARPGGPTRATSTTDLGTRRQCRGGDHRPRRSCRCCCRSSGRTRISARWSGDAAMQTQKDRVDAHCFLVKRMVSGLAAGDPTPEDQPARRASLGLIIGCLITALALIAFGIYGWLVPAPDTSWRQNNAIVVEKETGTRFVYRDGVLFPVQNYASALLIQGDGAGVSMVERRWLADVPRGPMVGIAGAPEAVPQPGDRLAGEWSICVRRVGDSAYTTVMLGPMAESSGMTREIAYIAGRDGVRQVVWQDQTRSAVRPPWPRSG